MVFFLILFLSKGTWKQYDGAMHKRFEPNVWDRVKGFFFTSDIKKKMMKDAQMAAKIMMPVWKGFSMNSGDITQDGDEEAAESFLHQIGHMYHCMKGQHQFLNSRAQPDESVIKEVSD